MIGGWRGWVNATAEVLLLAFINVNKPSPRESRLAAIFVCRWLRHAGGSRSCDNACQGRPCAFNAAALAGNAGHARLIELTLKVICP
jgi:hypothetical protein